MLPHSLTSVLELSITRCPFTFKEHNLFPGITELCILAVTFDMKITWNCSIPLVGLALAHVIPLMLFWVYSSIGPVLI